MICNRILKRQSRLAGFPVYSTGMNPHDINHYRFAKLIGDLHDTICFDASDEKKKRIIKRLEARFGLK